MIETKGKKMPPIHRSMISSLADERRRWTIRWDLEERNGCTNGAQENKGGDDNRQQKEQRGGDSSSVNVLSKRR